MREHTIGLGESDVGGASSGARRCRSPISRRAADTRCATSLAGRLPRRCWSCRCCGRSIVGALVVRPQAPGAFPPELVDLLQTFAAQSALAIQNARLFSEIEEKSRQLEIASQHKSQFLANMSHELRTPLNAILGFTELMPDGLYGEVPDKSQGARARAEERQHLLGLINDVLDLSKIEAGQLTLALDDYSIEEVVQTVVSATRVARQRRRARAQGRRAGGAADRPRRRAALTQVLLNLVGNAIKFTDTGRGRDRGRAPPTAASTSRSRHRARASPGATRQRIFEEFQQVDSIRHQPEGRHRARPRDLQADRRAARRHASGWSRCPARARRSGSTVPCAPPSSREAA